MICKKKYDCTLAELTASVEIEQESGLPTYLSFENQGLSTDDVDQIIATILMNKDSFSYLAYVNLAYNAMDRLPANLDGFLQFLENNAENIPNDDEAAFLFINNNPFVQVTFDDVLSVLACKYNHQAATLQIFKSDCDMISSLECRRFIFNTIMLNISLIDPGKIINVEDKPALKEQVIISVRQKLRSYFDFINHCVYIDEMDKLKYFVAIHQYEFRNNLLSQQVDDALRIYYSFGYLRYKFI